MLENAFQTVFFRFIEKLKALSTLMSNANAVSSNQQILRLTQSGGPSTSSDGLTSMIDSLCVQNKI